MSSSTGDRYRALAGYYTDPQLAEAIVRAFILPHASAGDTFLEGHAGGGAFLQALYTCGLVETDNVEVQDIDPEAAALAMPGDHFATISIDTGHHLLTGFLVTPPKFDPTWVLGNPPFGVHPPPRPCEKCKGSGYAKGDDVERNRRTCERCAATGTYTPRPVAAAEAHLRRALELTTRHVVYVLQSGIFGSAEREAFWSSAPLRHSAVLVPRPSYGGKDEAPGTGSDSVDHEVFWFDKRHLGPPTRSRLWWRRDNPKLPAGV